MIGIDLIIAGLALAVSGGSFLHSMLSTKRKADTHRVERLEKESAECQAQLRACHAEKMALMRKALGLPEESA